MLFFFFTMIEYTKMIIFGRLSKEQKTFFYLRKKKIKVCFVKIWVCRSNKPFDFNKNLI